MAIDKKVKVVITHIEVSIRLSNNIGMMYEIAKFGIGFHQVLLHDADTNHNIDTQANILDNTGKNASTAK